jgi:hypothetical protein
MAIFFRHGTTAHYHLAAYSDEGYRSGASFALFDVALDVLRADAAVLDLGGAAGLTDAADDGLSRFKRGWSTGVRPAYIGGVILDRIAYRAATARRGRSDFFPAYRTPS